MEATSTEGIFVSEQELVILNTNQKMQPLDTLEKISWDFKDAQTQYLTHKFHSYPARFIPQIPRTFIELFTKEGDTVLDPFCGCGTTLVEGSILNRYSVGNDLNPLATLLTRVKTMPLSDSQLLKVKITFDAIKNRISNSDAKEFTAPELPNRNISKLFTTSMLKELQIIKETIDIIKNDDTTLFEYLLVGLSATIRAIIESENGNNITGIFERKINAMTYLMRDYAKLFKKQTKVTTGDARKLNLSSNSVDLIVTSPPYVNALDYYRVHMYNMLWLGMDYNIFKLHEIGGHSHFLLNRFRLLSEYLGDMLRAMIEMNRVLKTGKVCAIVVGNSSIDYEMIESHKYFASMAKRIGFEHKKTLFRKIDRTSKYFVNGNIDDEYIVVLQKINNCNTTSDDETFIGSIVSTELKNFKDLVSNNPGSSTRGKPVTKERLQYNLIKIDEAIKNISQDIRIKIRHGKIYR